MADQRTDPSLSPSDAPDHLRTTIPSGGLSSSHADSSGNVHVNDEKEKNVAPHDDEENDEDIDQLIQELESEDGEAEEDEETSPGMSAKPIPEELLNTDTRTGLTSHEVT